MKVEPGNIRATIQMPIILWEKVKILAKEEGMSANKLVGKWVKRNCRKLDDREIKLG